MARIRLPTLLETVFALAILAMSSFAVVPTVRKVRNGVRVDLAAKSLAVCDGIARHYRKYHPDDDGTPFTLAFLESRRRDTDPEIVWPDSADLSTFEAPGTNGCSVRVTLVDGSSVVVTAASNLVDHAN